MQSIEFCKYQGAGNDFVMIDNRSQSFEWTPSIVEHLCNRRFGIGADGVILLESDSQSEFYMRYFNSDGSQVGMCGNGSRCVMLFAHHLGIGSSHKVFRALDGLHSGEIVSVDGPSAEVKVHLIDVESVDMLDSANYFANTGVNHHLEFVECVDSVAVVERGSEIRYSERYKERGGTNANFIEVVKPNHILLRTYERGVEDETLACGTGATAAALATVVKFGGDSPLRVSVRGGDLKIHFTKSGNGFKDVCLEGGAQRVFRGTINLFIEESIRE